ncbi:MAG: hypothetical protein RLZZ203_2502, partial [Cyanobacteriota bacterium]
IIFFSVVLEDHAENKLSLHGENN